MTKNNIETITALYQAFSRRDIPTILRLVDPEITVSQTELLPWGGTFHGIEGLQLFFNKLLQNVDSQVEAEEYVDAGEKVIVIGWTRGRVRATEVEFSVRVVHVWTVKDGKGVRFEPHIDTSKMLEVLGEDVSAGINTKKRGVR